MNTLMEILSTFLACFKLTVLFNARLYSFQIGSEAHHGCVLYCIPLKSISQPLNIST